MLLQCTHCNTISVIAVRVGLNMIWRFLKRVLQGNQVEVTVKIDSIILMFTQGQNGPKGDMVSIPSIFHKLLTSLGHTLGTHKLKGLLNNCVKPCFAVYVCYPQNDSRGESILTTAC